MPHFGLCHLSCIPVRADASERSEMINQLLFGETFEIIDQFKEWTIIRGSLDDYEGFIDSKQIVDISEDQFQAAQRSVQRFPSEIISVLNSSKSGNIWLTPASSLGLLSKDGKMSVGNNDFSYTGKTVSPSGTPHGNDIVAASKKYLNVPYLWGGRSLFGIDCSGLVQNVFKINGIALPRDASQQVKTGETVFLISEAVPGDLAFFENEQGEIVHVGIIINESEVIHASGNVRIDTIDHNGIFNKDIKKYSHKLRIIKRVIFTDRTT